MKPMKTDPAMRHYAALLAKSAEVGWPLRFPTDLTTHDKARLASLPLSAPFLWHLGSGGTHLRTIAIGKPDKDLAEWVSAVRQSFPDSRCFLWDGVGLHEMTDSQVIEWASDHEGFKRTARRMGGFLLETLDVAVSHLRRAFGEPDTSETSARDVEKGVTGEEWTFANSDGPRFRVYVRDGQVHLGGHSHDTAAFKAWLWSEIGLRQAPHATA